MLSWYKYLIVNLVFSHLGFWSGNLFSDCALLIVAYIYVNEKFHVALLGCWLIVSFVDHGHFLLDDRHRQFDSSPICKNFQKSVGGSSFKQWEISVCSESMYLTLQYGKVMLSVL